jgi:transposase-like protein
MSQNKTQRASRYSAEPTLTMFYKMYLRTPGIVVDIATAYGLDGPGIESRWRRDFQHLSIPALRPT